MATSAILNSLEFVENSFEIESSEAMMVEPTTQLSLGIQWDGLDGLPSTAGGVEGGKRKRRPFQLETAKQ